MKGGNSISNFAVIIILFIFFGFCITFIILVVTKPIKVSLIIEEKPAENKVKAEEVSSYSTLPPCFNLSTDAQHVFQILKSTKMDVKYIQLLKAYSLTLCQLQDFQTSCSVNSIKSRLSTLDSWGAVSDNSFAVSTVNSITRIQNAKSNTSQFLYKICDICEKNINAIKQDSNFSKLNITQIIGFNSEFYRSIFDKINKLCPNI